MQKFDISIPLIVKKQNKEFTGYIKSNYQTLKYEGGILDFDENNEYFGEVFYDNKDNPNHALIGSIFSVIGKKINDYPNRYINKVYLYDNGTNGLRIKVNIGLDRRIEVDYPEPILKENQYLLF